MKRVVIALLFISMMSFILAEACQVDVTLLNQDPYPAVQGDYVKLVFQVDGVANSECNAVTFELLEKYPLIFDAGQRRTFSINSGTYTGSNYQDFFMATYKVRVNSDALDGANPIEVRYNYGFDSTQTKEFDMEVEDVRADFEVVIKDYDYGTHELTLEILNIEDSDVEALTVQIPKQENIEVKGNNRPVVGDLDSNEYTTADFEAIIKDGEIVVDLIYSDAINVRRTVQKTVTFDSSYFTNRKADQKSVGMTTYVIWIAIISGLAWFIWKKIKKKKKR